MKPILEQVTHSSSHSFALREFRQPRFDYPWHSHPEFELNFIRKGKGRRYVGNSIKDFGDGDLVLVGSDLPHCWLSDTGGQSWVIQFRGDFLGDVLLRNPEMASIRKMLDLSNQGISFEGALVSQVESILQTMLKMNSFDRLIELLRLLNLLAGTKQYRLLSSKGFLFQAKGNDQDKERLGMIHKYIQSNFKKKIAVNDVADLISMTPGAFCKYFKKRTYKTFINYLNEFRVGYACRLIKETDLGMAQIAWESGFENLANFHRQFKKIAGYTPGEYKKN